jgi:hypothetical protein
MHARVPAQCTVETRQHQDQAPDRPTRGRHDAYPGHRRQP